MVNFRQETGDVGGDVKNTVIEGDGNTVTESKREENTNSGNTTNGMTTKQKVGGGIVGVLVAKIGWLAFSPDPIAAGVRKWLAAKFG